MLNYSMGQLKDLEKFQLENDFRDKELSLN
jgi:hypothetical protein